MNLRYYVGISLGLMTLAAFIIAVIFWPVYSYSLGIILGGTASLLGAWSLKSAVDDMPLREFRQTKRALLKNKLIRYAIYTVAIGLAVLLPSVFDRVTTIIALIVVKFLLVFTEFVATKRIVE